LTNAIISDTTGKTIKAELSYTVDLYSRGNKAHIKFDTEFNDQIKDLVRLARQNGVEWFSLKKNNDTGKWDKLKIDDPMQEKL
jgi:hypothetical protein